MNDEWPKQWNNIREDSGSTHGIGGENWLEYQGGLRGYQDTLYINADAGDQTDENRDLWLPLGVYLEQRSNGEIEG